MSYPLEKYKFYRHGNTVIAVSTYAGRTVRGTATCSENDTFDLETGKKLAAARCNLKVCRKRMKRAEAKYAEAQDAINWAQNYKIDANNYFADAQMLMGEAIDEYEALLEKV